MATQALADVVDDGVKDIQTRWAKITYSVIGEDQKDAEYTQLESVAERFADQYPDRPEPKIWQGIVLSTHAGVSGGLGALKRVKAARKLFEQAIALDDAALDGSAHTSLGSLYYQVPGWPLAFGNDDKAEAHLKHALEINPRGIDPNYFYGDYLFEQGRYAEAAQVLDRALSAPERPDRPLADAGRRQEVRALMGKVKKKLGS
jgi:tetratricopeptide (TPR) repeat protein